MVFLAASAATDHGRNAMFDYGKCINIGVGPKSNAHSSHMAASLEAIHGYCPGHLWRLLPSGRLPGQQMPGKATPCERACLVR